MNEASATKLSALDKLKALSSKKPSEGEPATEALSGLGDPAISGAKRNKNTITLGIDPSITDDARTCAALRGALNKAEAQFKVFQAKLRDYGKDKRSKYNDAFKASVTTVSVPYTVEVPGEGSEAIPGREEKVVQVICTAKYSVSEDTVLALEKEMGEKLFGRLFEKDEKKVLKPNAEELVRDLLGELGIQGEELDTAMDRLFDTQVKVKAVADYETEIKDAPEPIQQILEQAVVRQAPGLKFS